MARSIKGIDYDSIDNKPAHLFFMIAVPENSDQTYLKVLAELSIILVDSSIVLA